MDSLVLLLLFDLFLSEMPIIIPFAEITEAPITGALSLLSNIITSLEKPDIAVDIVIKNHRIFFMLYFFCKGTDFS